MKRVTLKVNKDVYDKLQFFKIKSNPPFSSINDLISSLLDYLIFNENYDKEEIENTINPPLSFEEEWENPENDAEFND